jgi:hypothetical protein
MMINKEEAEVKIRKLDRMSSVVDKQIYADKENTFIVGTSSKLGSRSGGSK